MKTTLIWICSLATNLKSKYWYCLGICKNASVMIGAAPALPALLFTNSPVCLSFSWSCWRLAGNYVCSRRLAEGPFTHAIFDAIYRGDFEAIYRTIPNRPCKPAAISWRFDCDLSPIFRTCSNFDAIYRPFDTFRREIAGSLHGSCVL